MRLIGDQIIEIPTHDDVVLGRVDDADVVIADASVSRRHACLRGSGDRPTIQDLGSRHGSAVNGIRLDGEETIPLHEGDIVRIGLLDFLVEGAPESTFDAKRPRATAPESISRDQYQTRGSLLLRLGDDDSLVREVSWQAFHDQYAPIIRGFARNVGTPKSLVDDLVQEVMAGFFRASERFEYDPGKGRFRGYLKTVVIRALSSMRHKRRGEQDWEEERFLEQPASVERVWGLEWTAAMLLRAMREARVESRLTDRSWDAFELTARRGVPLEEAAEQLGMSPDAVKKARTRVSATVRDHLDRLRSEEG